MRSIRLALGTGIDAHALEWAAPDAVDHTVLLVHGFLDHAWTWEDVGTRLAQAGLHVVAPDMRGHGDSARIGPGGYYHFLDYVVDLLEIVRLTARPRLSLVGHSMGGGICAYFAGAFPDRLHRLAIVDGLGVPSRVTSPEGLATWARAWVAAQARTGGRTLASLDEAAARLRKHDPRLTPALALRLAERGTRPTADGRLAWKHDPLHLTPGVYGVPPEAVARFLAAIACPTLLVDAADALGDAALRAERAALLKDARQVTIADSGHAIMRHQPVALAEAILAHVR
jgi:pimeloyl-ACP methyl ester carboxylesterase